MRVDVNLSLEVDPEANFLECYDENTLFVLMELIKEAFYDIDDVTIKSIDLEKV